MKKYGKIEAERHGAEAYGESGNISLRNTMTENYLCRKLKATKKLEAQKAWYGEERPRRFVKASSVIGYLIHSWPAAEVMPDGTSSSRP